MWWHRIQGAPGLVRSLARRLEDPEVDHVGAGTDELREVALSNGMLTLRMDGLKKVERGATTLEEGIKETAASD